ncbi:hypothetical protein DTO271D3_1519 [Paecilomyces variotii]|nr:hypothetical protein DTO169C6_162 [Paecilomyces variotii]KAJ9318262.1 hypothetical protein DTO271D3_1519 [Paecilomyces variotii]
MPEETDGPSKPLDICVLPQELFFMILNYLEPPDVIRCRRVCKSWYNVFGNPTNLIPLLKKWYPLAKEVRELREKGILNDLNLKGEEYRYCQRIFDRVTSRYDHLARGEPRSIRKFRLCLDNPDYSSKWFQVPPWESHKSHPNGRVDKIFKQVFWTYEDGLLVYPSEVHRSLVLLDLNTDATFVVPFPISNKVIRRVRLQDKLLVVEWAEPNVFHWLNDDDGVHRHFASSFDIRPEGEGWDITFRNEWKIMFLGHPLSERDRFFSSHNNTHYVVYAWQPNRSLYTGDEDAPIESLFVWDISQPSSYRPSLDPTGREKGDDSGNGPTTVARLGFRDLGFYSVRQRGCPRIMKLDINSEACTVDITENVSMVPGDPSANPQEWDCDLQTISIPFHGHGPCWKRNAGISLPAYRGNSGMQPAPLTTEFPWYRIIYETSDPQAQVSFSVLSQNINVFGLTGFFVTTVIRTPYSCTTMSHEGLPEISYKGMICGNERYVIGESKDNELVVFQFDR